MYRSLLLLLLITTPIFLTAQNFWREIAEPNQADYRHEEKPSQFKSYQIDFEGLTQHLAKAPKEENRGFGESLNIKLPHPDGTAVDYEVFESSVMMPGLSAKFPNIKSYKGYSANGSDLRISATPEGITIIYNTSKGRAYLIPYAEGNNNLAMGYYKKHSPATEGFVCGVDGTMIKNQHRAMEQHAAQTRNQMGVVSIRQYRVAIACTGEWAQMNGGTVGSALSAMNTVLNLINSIYENELAVRLTLVDNNEKVVFTNSNTDPYTNTNMGGALLGQNQGVLNDSIGVSNYDVGHIFTRACSDVGGVAGGPVCDNGTKGRGVTCQFTNLIEVIESVTTHELGHQFSAGHTWNNCPPTLENSPGQFRAGSAFEPGSGTTIMSYAGLCGDQNIAFDNDLYFNAGSLNEIYFFIANGTGSTCGQRIETENIFPEVTLPYTNGFTIPISTPFELTAEGSDANGDLITYCWEGYDLGPIALIGQQVVGTSPLFRSLPPKASPTRVFPKINTILTNGTDEAETLPTYSRDLKFRCTVRDNNEMIGGVAWEQVDFRASDQAGPFLVEFPNANTDNLEVGQYVEIKWDVANTDKSPVNCKNVNILLSVNGGFNFTIPLLENTPNDGSEFIVVPNTTTGTARIKVAAADNIFFDLSNDNFVIAPPSAPGYALNVTPRAQQACLPDNIEIEVITSSLLNYDSMVQLEVIDGLPAGAVASFSANPVMPGDTALLTIDLQNVTAEGSFPISVQTSAPSTDTIVREITFNTVSNDYSGFAITGPMSGASGISSLPTFSWTDIVAADEFEIEVATSPIFGDSIKYTTTGISDTTHQPNIVLDENTLYYWRVRPSNSCGSGDFTEIAAFHTESLSCNTFVADNVPINISATGTPTVESILPITLNGEISDVNIPILKGTHDLVKHMDAKLVSPMGTEVVLFSDLCGNTQIFNIGLDDEAPTELPCPPNDQVVHKPQNSLDTLDGENASGDWILQLVVVDGAGEGGALDEWSLELCSNVSLNSPYLVLNETLEVNPLNRRFITNDFLLVEDDNNTSTDLIFTLVSLPLNGKVALNEVDLEIGAQFSQSDLNNSRVRYEHTGVDKETDTFQFTVVDGEGGWLGILEFDISVDSDFMVSTSNLPDDLVSLYPNPTSGELNLQFSRALTGDVGMSIYNIQGQRLREFNPDLIFNQLSLNVSTLQQGVYILKIQAEEGVLTKRFVLQK